MSYERGSVFCEVFFLLRDLRGENRTFYETIIIYELVKVLIFPFLSFPQKRGT